MVPVVRRTASRRRRHRDDPTSPPPRTTASPPPEQQPPGAAGTANGCVPMLPGRTMISPALVTAAGPEVAVARWRWLAHSWRVEIDPHLVRCDRRRRRRRGRPQNSLRREQSRKEEEPEVSDNRTKQARPRRASAYARPRLRRGRRPTPAFSPPGRQHGSTSLRRPTHPPGRQEVMVSTWPPGTTPRPGRARRAPPTTPTHPRFCTTRATTVCCHVVQKR